MSDWTVSGGFSFQRANYRNTTNNVINEFRFDTDLSFNRYGLFGQVSRKFSNERLGLSFGLRADGNSFTTDGGNLLSTLSPRLSASYKLDEAQKWSVNASVGRYYKIPPYTILGFQNNDQDFVNQDIDYTQSDHLVLGVEHLLILRLRISVEGFYKSYDNYPVSLTDSVSLANLGADFEVLGNEPVVSVGLGQTSGWSFCTKRSSPKVPTRFWRTHCSKVSILPLTRIPICPAPGTVGTC